MFASNRVRRAILAAYSVAMLIVFLVPVPQPPRDLPGTFDKLVHGVLFLGFAVLALWNLRPDRRARTRVTLAAAAGFAAVVEALQMLLPYRSGDVVDLLAGIGGALLGAGLTRAWEAWG